MRCCHTETVRLNTPVDTGAKCEKTVQNATSPRRTADHVQRGHEYISITETAHLVRHGGETGGGVWGGGGGKLLRIACITRMSVNG